MKDKITIDPFAPDFDKHRFSIIIEVYANTNIYRLAAGNVKDYYPTVQEIVGSIEVVKHAYLREHGAKVQKAYKKRKPTQGTDK